MSSTEKIKRLECHYAQDDGCSEFLDARNKGNAPEKCGDGYHNCHAYKKRKVEEVVEYDRQMGKKPKQQRNVL